MSNPGTENAVNFPLNSSMDDLDDQNKTDKNEKLTKLKGAFKDQIKDFSLDTMLLAGAQAAVGMSFSNTFAFGSGNAKVIKSIHKLK